MPGREKYALDVYSEVVQFLGRSKEQGKIESFDVVVLGPTGGDLTGFTLAKGTAAQMDALRRSDEFLRLMNRVQLVAQHVRIADAYLDEGLAPIMNRYTEEVGRVGV